VDLDRLTTSISVEIAVRIGSNWDEWFGVLLRFKAREGHCNVPARHIEAEYRLGSWVNLQRTSLHRISEKRRSRLDAIGFVWDARDDAWDEGLAALAAFKKREGHCDVQQTHFEGTFNLGQWVSLQRARKELMFAERKRRLDEIGFIWNALDSGWEDGFAQLMAFKAQGHSHRRNDNPWDLGRYAAQEQGDYVFRTEKATRRGWHYLGSARKSVGGRICCIREQFKAREGHCNVPRPHVEGDLRLGQWVSVQRNNSATMSTERKQRLYFCAVLTQAGKLRASKLKHSRSFTS
jgi:hypothetical protein